MTSFQHKLIGDGTYGTSPPRNGKDCCRKMMLLPKALFLATSFPKIVKNAIFLLTFYQSFSRFSQNFPTIWFFRPNSQKINAQFVQPFGKYAKIMHFLKFSKINFLKIFENFRKFYGIRRAPPPDLLRGRLPKVFPLNRNPGGAAALQWCMQTHQARIFSKIMQNVDLTPKPWKNWNFIMGFSFLNSSLCDFSIERQKCNNR